MLNRLARYLCLITAALLLGACTNDDSIKANIRLLNASPDYASLDLYADDELKISAVAYENASGYAKLDADTYTLKLKSNGVSSTLQTLDSEKLSQESHQAYVGYGTSGHFATLKIGEDQGTPDNNKTSLLVLNTANAGSLDVYLTDDSVNLTDASPLFSAVTNGSAASGYQTIDSGNYRVRVTAAGDKNDVRFDQKGVSFGNKQILNLILSATQGGTLVNVLWLPQQGNLSKLANNKARVRGAAGVSSGSVTASVGSATLFTNAIMGAISSSYQQIDAGTAAVSLSVGGTPVTVADQTLEAGGDYTLLVWENGSGTQITLIKDDNRLPSDDSKAKIRLMNGMSALAAATTLSVDYSPVAENVAVGQASNYAEIDSGSDYTLAVSNANTTANVYSGTATLNAQNVYTMFVAGDGTSSGTSSLLRKDR